MNVKLASLNPALRAVIARSVGASPQAAQIQPQTDEPEIDLSELLSALQGGGGGGGNGGGSCGCSAGGGGDGYDSNMDGYLPVAGQEVTTTSAGDFTITINTEGRPVKGSRLFMQSSAGIFSISEIKLGNNTQQIAGYVAGFAMDPKNQNGNGVEIVATDAVFNSLTQIVIKGTVSAGATVQAQLMSNNPALYAALSCGPVKRYRRP